ncbi:oxygenase [Sandarakinorhabdus cyanobacteriorum]|uniref:Oxygenase n=1 Tax=Sandarakinorhabdus cyanobacteriorum TaxID=1981098 RepID=A0A255Y4A1_9SPHN|nr:2OG-Fe(II) oxygenase [Sandarakinorhabdus cyanobacteriorum]OYQ24038.1 oxygenase [Sandarakinorhabdus cyanobacteriorum]
MRFSGAQRVPDSRVEMFIRKKFLSADECSGLIALIDGLRRPSTITDAYGADADFRTSETADLPGDDPLVRDVYARLADYAGLPIAHAELLQGQRYAPGQQFKAHTDYFEPTGLDYFPHTEDGGQRSWTMMVYLNEPRAGGATRFVHLNKLIQPETGKLVAWHNRTADGGVNANTLHAGMPVRAGTKYVITAWFRDGPRARPPVW